MEWFAGASDHAVLKERQQYRAGVANVKAFRQGRRRAARPLTPGKGLRDIAVLTQLRVALRRSREGPSTIPGKEARLSMERVEHLGPSHNRSAPIRLEPVIVGIAAFLLYAITGARDLQWGDPAKLTLYVHNHVLAFSQEQHFGQILWALPFSLLPIQPYAWRMQLVSAMTLGAAIGVGEAVLLRLGFSRWASRIAMAAVAVSHTVWFTGTIFESYPLVLLLLAAAAWAFLVARRPLLGGALLGYGVTVHPIVLFGLPGIAYGLLRSSGRPRTLLRLAGGLIVGSSVPILGVMLLQPGRADLAGFNWAAASARYGGLGNPLHNLPMLLGYAVYNLASPALILLLLGLRRLSSTARWTLVLFAAPHYLVAAFWLPQRAYLIPIPVYFIAAYLIARGADSLRSKRLKPGWAMLGSVVALPVLLYAIAPMVFTRLRLQRIMRDAPYRSEAEYFLRPWKNAEHSVRQYLDDLATVLPPSAIAVGDWVLYTTVQAGQEIEDWRPDVTLVSGSATPCDELPRPGREGRRVFVLDAAPGYVPDCLLQMGTKRAVPGVERLIEIEADSAR